MKCLTCNAEIPPQWVNAIQRNECPGCGGQIMDDASKELLNELKEAMTKMPNDPQGLAGWLLSNYTLRKVGTAEPTTFHRKPVAPAPGQPRTGQKPGQSQKPGRQLKVAKNSVQDFLKRKDPGIAKSVESQRDFADIVEQINNGVDDPYGNGVELETEIDEESSEFSGEVVSEDGEYDQEYASGNSEDYEEAEDNRRNFQSKAKVLARHSLVVPGNSRPLSAQETAAMMHAVAGKTSGVDPGDNMPEILQIQRMDRLKKQRAIAGGGTDDFGSGRGTFRRG